jgi:putative N6-adenine-specific DNA methylase
MKKYPTGNMSPETPLAKRIKRHVIGRMRTYFSVTAPGLENLCLNELQPLPLAVKEATVSPGGVRFNGRLQDCYLANLYLRTANRILLRIGSFKATHFSRLEKNVAAIPWELYLRPEHRLKIHITAKHCRLYHTQAIANRILENMNNHLPKIETEGQQELSSSVQRIFVRGEDDRFTLSIDSSGEMLYKRGLKKHHSAAPLRENLAAAALLLAGYTGSEPLIDPMCGSGTFALEGALMAKQIPPGWFREFAFMGWPSYRPKRWEYLKRQAEGQFAQAAKPHIFASDKDPNICSRLEQCIIQNGLSDVIQVISKNFFDSAPHAITDQAGVVTINPPYGLRIGTHPESKKLFRAICDKLQADYKTWRLVLIAPSEKLADGVPFNLRTYPLFHGGLKLVLMVGRI